MQSTREAQPLSIFLSRGNNNLDLIRLLTATAVIYGHSFALIPNHAVSDVLYRLTGVYSAEWGVKTFFFLSGLLVVNSIITDRNPYSYAIKRVMRIWPALAFVVLGTAFIIGPICTKFSINEYFSNANVYSYVIKMLSFDIWGNNNIALPGVFESNRIAGIANAPLWTLSIEAFAYALILALYLIGALSQRVALILFLVFLVDALLPGRVIFWWLPKNNPDFAYIPFCFAIGGLLAVYKDRVMISLPLISGFIILSLIFKGWEYHKYLIYATMFLSTLYIATLPKIISLPKIPDISYGIYLWGWPIQQAVVSICPALDYWVSLALTYFAVYGIALLSWFLIERPSIDLGKNVVNRLKRNATFSNSR